MDSKPTIARQSSGMKNIPSFNDFGSMAAEDVDVAPVAPRVAPVAVPKPTMLHRGWSIESSSPPSSRSLSTPLASSFSETFTRALYEHMRGN